MADLDNRCTRSCSECGNIFLTHYKQFGGSLTLPVNISRRDYLLTIYSVNIHKNSYDFYSAEETKKKNYFCREKNFVPNGKVNVEGSIVIINCQPSVDGSIEQKSRRIWLTKVFTRVYFNRYVRDELSKNFIKKVIVNGLTGSSWQFKIFNRLSVIVTVANTDLSLA